MASATAQLNARIGVGLKNDGDAVFAQYGLSPSEVVRAVWSYAAERRRPPDFMLEPAEVERAAELERRLALVEEGAGLATRLAGRPSAGTGSLDWGTEYAQVRDDLREERARGVLAELDGLGKEASHGTVA